MVNLSFFYHVGREPRPGCNTWAASVSVKKKSGSADTPKPDKNLFLVNMTLGQDAGQWPVKEVSASASSFVLLA